MMWQLVLVIAIAQKVYARVDFCAAYTFPTNSSWLQFTKERVDTDYALENNFKSLHCCGKGYRSIEWWKDGHPYPWASHVSNFMLYPEAANQTVYTQRVGRMDRGNYTCRMRNETHTHTHTISLQVDEKPPESPKMTYEPKDQKVEIGSNVRLYCEAFVSRVYLADAHSDIGWQRVWPTGLPDLGIISPLPHKYNETKITREKEDIVGAYLLIEALKAEDYGEYVCTVRSNDVVTRIPVTLHYLASSHSGADIADALPWRTMLVWVAVAGAVVATACVLHSRFSKRIALAIRIARHRATAGEARPAECGWDALVACCAIDGELVRGALLPALTHKYNYTLRSVELDTLPHTWYEVLVREAEGCRAVVVVMSPSLYSPPQLLVALKQLRALPVPPVLVLLQDVPKLKHMAKDACGESVAGLLRRLRIIPWRHLQERAFWTALRLALPLPSPLRHPSHEDAVDLQSKGRGAPDSRSGSIDALV